MDTANTNYPHVGLICGVGPVASAAYTSVLKGEGVSSAVALVEIDQAEAGACFRSHDDQGLKRMVAQAASGLAANGICQAAIACFTLHVTAEAAFREAGIGFIDAREVLRTEIQRRKKQLAGSRIGVIGTRRACARGLLSGVISNAGAHAVIPAPELGARLEDAIFDRLAWQRHSPKDADLIREVIADLRSRGASSFLVGCTDLSAVIREVVAAERDLIDLPALHAHAIAKVAAAGPSRNIRTASLSARRCV